MTTLPPDAIVWACYEPEVLQAMLGVLARQLRELLPAESSDPFEQIAADFDHDPTERLRANPRLSRIYPPALADEQAAADFWRDSVTSQTRARLEALTLVARQCGAADGPVPVTLHDADAWVKTLSALRLFWHTELAGSHRLAEAHNDGSQLYQMVEWLGYLIEDLIASREVCLAEGQGLEL